MAERAALVTGGSSGIGLAIARYLGQDGYSLTVSARRPEKLEAAVKGLRDEGLEGRVEFTGFDAIDPMIHLSAGEQGHGAVGMTAVAYSDVSVG